MFHLSAFGGLTLGSDSVPLSSSSHQRRRLTLLVRLAAAGPGGVGRDRLLAELWPESSAPRAQHALDQLLYSTRRDLGKEAVLTEGRQLRLNGEVVRSDLAEFAALLGRERWEEATALYRGPFLDGVHLGGSAELEHWVDAERSRLETRYVNALECLARTAAARGDVHAAVAALRKRAATMPLSARCARDLVGALIAAGDRAGAVQYARTYGALVRHQLGVEPDPGILALAEQEPPASPAAADAAAPPPSRRDIPAKPDPSRAGRRLRRPAAQGWTAVLTAVLVLVSFGAASSLRNPASPLPPPVDVSSVAVLPFEDLSADGGAEYLGDGMSEELIHALAQVRDLRVAARTSAFTFKDRRADIREIARSLGVSAVVEGSVRRERDRLRVNAQLIDATTGHHLWSGSFDRQIGDALTIQGEIADSIVRTLRPRLARAASPLGSSAPEVARAYHLVLQGRYAWNQRTESALRRAVGFFDEAIAADPGYAAAHAGLSDTYDALVDGGFEPAEAGYARAEAAARRAIALDSTLAEGHASLGHVRFHRWDWRGAERDFARALELNPGYALAYARAAMPLVMQGRFAEGLAVMRRAQELDPLALSTHNQMGWLLFLAGRHEEAIDQLRAVIAMDSTRVSSHARLGLSLVERGRYEEGVPSLERAVELGGDYYRSALPMLGYAYAKAGRRGDAERIRARVERELTASSINPYYAAALMGALGERDRAFALLDHAFRTNRGCLIDLGVDPMMSPLRADSRYGALVDALGMELVERGS